ncbi:MAG: DNA polymerase Y family protein [Acidimicrobiia bacterium]|nr:DNA polymerase Y family protein [Acidimicrobiia bacterium]MYC46471.1 DNA polymerase Y family protein [Acidimicrobiia bacterium]
MSAPVRTLVARCEHWPVVALGHPLTEPVAVVAASRVVAASVAARSHGVVPGLRLRTAAARCVDLVVRERDPALEARAFEPVVATLDDVTPALEVSRPGTCSFAARGPSRYFGGDEVLAGMVLERVTQALEGRTGVRIGIADGPFTAAVAAELADPVRIIEPACSAAFLAPLPVRMLGLPELTDVLVRLGIDTLGAFAGLPAADVLARFGTEGRRAHCLAAGNDERPLTLRAPTPDWSVSTEFDPPADRLDQLAFCARALAEQLQRRLEKAGMSCVRIAVEVETAEGESLVRLWRHEGGLSAGDMVDRVRWFLDDRPAGSGGPLPGSGGRATGSGGPAVSGNFRPSSGITRLRLTADELAPARGRQLGFWGGEAGADERAVRVAAHLCGRLGAEVVRVPDRRGGRHPDEQFTLVPAAAVDLRDRRLTADDRPWPGGLPAPSPARLLVVPWPAEVHDAAGDAVRVTGRGSVSAPPARLTVGGRSSAVVAWGGPWSTEERWWDPGCRRRRARLQLLTGDGLACLAVLERGRWQVTAVWD